MYNIISFIAPVFFLADSLSITSGLHKISLTIVKPISTFDTRFPSTCYRLGARLGVWCMVYCVFNS